MNKLIVTLFFVSAIIFSVSAQPKGFVKMKNVAAFSKKMAAEADKTITINSDFIQKKFLSFMESEIVSEGKFKYKKGNKLRWEYTEPYSYIIVLAQETVLIKEEGKKTKKYDMSANKTFQRINELMVNSVRGTVLENDEFDVSYYENSKQNLLHLLPKSKEMKGMLDNVYIYFNKSDNQVSAIKMTENSGDYTQITFKNRKLNEKLSDDNFVLR